MGYCSLRLINWQLFSEPPEASKPFSKTAPHAAHHICLAWMYSVYGGQRLVTITPGRTTAGKPVKVEKKHFWPHSHLSIQGQWQLCLLQQSNILGQILPEMYFDLSVLPTFLTLWFNSGNGMGQWCKLKITLPCTPRIPLLWITQWWPLLPLSNVAAGFWSHCYCGYCTNERLLSICKGKK